ncbi:hypothetical protein KORDIASMS9_04146 [Kordia sp. SMS9]|uniref:hypothetical protein n=1 Tax=Kordia sp. SMS9 TaxID=2282170 RepID=UPI000E0DE5DB|nr:hypothetical protein [Kordia sp. SMS9]AXG71888.1 hypothetical protein KORDIASMS9_04146 [Kordia sp. SMS9]
MQIEKRIQLKPRLQISKIGKIQFWLGLFYGLLNAVVFYLFVFYLIDFMMVFMIAIDGDLPLQTKSISFFETSFLAATSLSLGITMMIRHWFMRPTFRFQRSHKKISLRISNYSLFIYYLVLYVAIVYIRFFVFGKTFTGVYQPVDYTNLLFIIPLYLFFVAWTEVSRYFVANKWIISAFLIGLLTIFFLNSLNIKPTTFSEKAFKIMQAEELKYLDHELKKAKEKYNLQFSEETVSALKELRSKRSFELLEKVRLAFTTDKKVSLDTIILEKILIHNFKGYYKGWRDSYAYIFPFQAYEQLRKVDSQSSQATELILVLEEFYKLSILMMEIPIDNHDNLLYQKKVSILEDQLYNYDSNEYRKMFYETIFLVKNLQKLNRYDHPMFNIETPLPPSMYRLNAKIQEKFPELVHPIE